MSDNIIQFTAAFTANNATTKPTTTAMNNATTADNIVPFSGKNTTKPKRKAITLERVIDMASREDYEGICLACGEDAEGVEPDAREYTCESCGADRVYGAEELVFMV